MYTFHKIPVKIPTAFFTELEQTVLKCVWNGTTEELEYLKQSLKRKAKLEASQFQSSSYYKVVVIKTV